MDTHELKEACIRLMEVAEAAFLSTVDEKGFPNTRAMLNLRNREQYPRLAASFEKHREDFLIYITTNTSSLKMRHISRHPAVCVYFCEPGEYRGLMLTGKVEIVTDRAIKRAIWQDGWERYYPGGPDDPDYTILRLLPCTAKGWYEGQPFEFKIG